MKKLILLFLAITCLVSCNCQYCGERKCVCNEYGVRYNYDYFCADKLLGEWQISYPCKVGNMEIKDIKFFDGWKCDIIMAESRNTDWFTETWTYTYVGKYITFSRIGKSTTFSFYVDGYIYPELYLKDSFGTYTWRKIKPYDCISN